MNDAINKALGENKELHVMKGLFMNPMKAKKQTGESYYGFDLKVLKQFGEDSEYGQSYNLYNIIIPSEVAMHYTDDDIKNFKDSEVIVIATTKCSVGKGENNSKYNKISFYCMDITQTRKVVFRNPVGVAETQRQAL